jgi:hypothetical protein
MSYPNSTIVRNLPKGSIVNVISKSSGGSGIIATDFLILDDNTFIAASAAETYVETPAVFQDFNVVNGLILTAVVLGVIYLFNKYSKKSK